MFVSAEIVANFLQKIIVFRLAVVIVVVLRKRIVLVVAKVTGRTNISENALFQYPSTEIFKVYCLLLGWKLLVVHVQVWGQSDIQRRQQQQQQKQQQIKQS